MVAPMGFYKVLTLVSVLAATTATGLTTTTTTPSAAVLAGNCAADAAHIQALAATATFCTDIHDILQLAEDMSQAWAAAFNEVAEHGTHAEGETAAASNAWASAFQTLAEEWSHAWTQCPMALVDISATALSSSTSWATTFTSFAQHSTGHNGVGSAASSSNTWAYSYFKFFDVYAMTYGAVPSCSDVSLWADNYQTLYDHILLATVSWAAHFKSYSGSGYASKASAVNSWSAPFQRAAEVVDVASDIWSQTCTTAAAAEAEAASAAVAYMVGNFSNKIHQVPIGWSEVFENCASSTTCLAAAASSSNTWASQSSHMYFAHASALWSLALASDAARFNAASRVWAHSFGQIDLAAKEQSTSWTQLFLAANAAIIADLTPIAASASNNWAFFFQCLATAFDTASSAWTSLPVEVGTSDAWSDGFKDMAIQAEIAMVEWVKGFEGSSTALSLADTASASNSWAYVLNKLASHGASVSGLYASNLQVSAITPEYSAASAHWAASFLTLAQRASFAASEWAKPYAIGATTTLSALGTGATYSAADSWAYLFTVTSNTALASATEWNCVQCPSSWLPVFDFLLDAATSSPSPGAEWMSVLSLTAFPGSWLWAAMVITTDRATLAP